MKNLLENARVLSAVVGNIESYERSFQDKGLLNIQKDINLYGGDKFLPHGDDKFSFIFDQR